MEDLLMVDELTGTDVVVQEVSSIFGEMEMEMDDYSELETYVMDMGELN